MSTTMYTTNRIRCSAPSKSTVLCSSCRVCASKYSRYSASDTICSAPCRTFSPVSRNSTVITPRNTRRCLPRRPSMRSTTTYSSRPLYARCSANITHIANSGSVQPRRSCPRRRGTPARMSAAMPNSATASVHGLAGSALRFCANERPSACRAASTGVMPNTHARNAQTAAFSSSMMRRKKRKLSAIRSPSYCQPSMP